MNSIDTRDLADVYLSSTFNEPSSVDISKAVKKYIIEGEDVNAEGNNSMSILIYFALHPT